MNRFVAQMSPARRQQILDEAYAAGRFGATRLPMAIASDGSISDTGVRQAFIALEEGRQQRDYDRWLALNLDRLADAMDDAGVQGDRGAWLRQQYTIETGRQP